MSPSLQYFKVLYTKQITKKHKTYHDGFLRAKEKGTAILYDERGSQLASDRVPGRLLPLASFMEGQLQISLLCAIESLHSAMRQALHVDRL